MHKKTEPPTYLKYPFERRKKMSIFEIYRYLASNHDVISLKDIHDEYDQTTRLKYFLDDRYSNLNRRYSKLRNFFVAIKTFVWQRVIDSRISIRVYAYKNEAYLQQNNMSGENSKIENELINDIAGYESRQNIINNVRFQRRAQDYAKVIFRWDDSYPQAVRWRKSFPRETAILVYNHALGIISCRENCTESY